MLPQGTTFLLKTFKSSCTMTFFHIHFVGFAIIESYFKNFKVFDKKHITIWL
jgi:vancomycin permeability regulator SanA